MRACHLRIQAHHFGLDPEPEVHPEGVDVVDDRSQPLRPSFWVDSPVTEGASVVSATRHPAIVEHESFDANRCRNRGQRPQPLEVVVEINRLPGVQDDRARPERPPTARPRMEALGDPVETDRRPRRKDLR